MPETVLQFPSDTILFGEKRNGVGDFLMDLRTANEVTVLEQSRHAAGANYAFADGSARFLRFGECLQPVNLWAVLPEAPTQPETRRIPGGAAGGGAPAAARRIFQHAVAGPAGPAALLWRFRRTHES